MSSFTWPEDDLSRRWDGKWLEVRPLTGWKAGGGLVVLAGRPPPARLSGIRVSESALRRRCEGTAVKAVVLGGCSFLCF